MRKAIFFLISLTLILGLGCERHRHYKHEVYKLHGNKYVVVIKNVWWEYDSPDTTWIYQQPWVSESGSVRLPMGGVWSKTTEPPKSEIEEELEISVEETNAVPEADAPDSSDDADASGSDDGGSDSGSSDSGSDGGDSGGDGGSE